MLVMNVFGKAKLFIAPSITLYGGVLAWSDAYNGTIACRFDFALTTRLWRRDSRLYVQWIQHSRQLLQGRSPSHFALRPLH